VETSTVLMAFGRGRQRHDIYRNPNHNAHLPTSRLGLISAGRGRIPLRLARRMTKCLARVAVRVFKRTRFRLCRKLKSITPLTFSAAPTARSAHRIRERIVFLPGGQQRPSCPKIFSATQRPGLLVQSLPNSSAFPQGRANCVIGIDLPAWSHTF